MPAALTLFQETGPFDIIGDVHGCYEELLELLRLLGYQIEFLPETTNHTNVVILHPENRKLIFVGDLVDRGPDTPAVLKLVMNAVNQKKAYCVIGNHDDKLLRKLSGRNVQVKNGLAQSLEQLQQHPLQFKNQVRQFLEALPYYLHFDNGALLIAHGGLPEDYHGKGGKSLRAICLYGPTSGKLDELGMPARLDWASDYSGKPFIVFGHSPVAAPIWKNNTVNVDTGCVFGGMLTALRYPEMKTLSIPAKNQYAVPNRPFK